MSSKFLNIYKKIIFESESMDNVELEYYNEFSDELKNKVDEWREEWVNSEYDMSDNPSSAINVQERIIEDINEEFEDSPIILVKVMRVVSGTVPGQEDEIQRLKNKLVSDEQKEYFDKLLLK